MQNVSSAFKAAIQSLTITPVRRITLTLVDNLTIATGIGVSAAQFEAALFPATKAVNGITVPERQWGLADPYTAQIYGARCFPDTSYPIDTGYEGGWIGSTLADAHGYITSNGAAGNGTYNGGFTLKAPGALNNGATIFDGIAGSYVSVPTTTNFTNHDFSVEAWIKPASLAVNQYAVFQAFVGGVEFILFVYPGGYLIANIGGVSYNSAPGVIPYDVWSHVVVTYKHVGTTLTLYVNGVQVLQSIATDFTGVNPSLYIGASLGSFIPFKGGLDEVALYSTTLTPTQVAAHYAARTGCWAYYIAVHADSPFRYYQLGEFTGTTAFDIGSDAQNGTYHGGFTLGAPDAFGGDSDTAVTLNGTTGYVSIPTLDISNKSFSIEFWMRPGATPPATQQPISFGNVGVTGQRCFFLLQSNGNLIFSFFSDDLSSGAGAITFGAAWYHIVATYNATGNVTTLYINGTQVAQGTHGPFTVAAPGMYIGVFNGGTSDWFKGDMDEVAIYLYALTGPQVTAHYGAEAVNYASYVLMDSPARYYRHGESSGTTAVNLAGTGETFEITYSPAVTLQQAAWWADENLGRPVDFRVSYDPQGNGFYTQIASVIGHTGTSWTYTFGALTTVTKLKIEIIRTNHPQTRAKLMEIGGYWAVDVSDQVGPAGYTVLAERGADNATIQVGNASAGSFDLDLKNTTGDWSPHNLSSIYQAYLRANRKLDVSVGVRYDDGSTELVPLGQYFSMNWAAPGGGPTATVRAQDGMKRLRDRKYLTCPLYVNQTVTQLILQALLAAGFGAGQYVVAQSSTVIPYAWCPPTDTFMAYLTRLAAAVGGVIYFDKTGAFHFEDATYLLANKTTPVITFTDSNAVISTQDEWDEGQVKNRITCNVNPLAVQASAQLWALQETLTVPLLGTLTINVTFGAPATVVSAPVITAAGGVTQQSWTAYGMGGTLVLQNANAFPATVTAITISGQSLKADGGNIVIAENTIAEATDGVRELPVNNPFIQTRAQAQGIVNDLLSLYQNPPARLHVETIGLPHLQLGDCVTVTSTMAGIDANFWVIRHQFTDDGGFKSSLDLQAVVYSTDLPTRATLWHEQATVLTGAAFTVPQTNTAQPYNTYTKQSTVADGDSFSHALFLRAGVYTFSALGITGPDAGKVDWYLDNVKFTAGQDWYAGSFGFNTVKTATITIPTDGYHTLKGVVNGHNASSSSYVIYLTKYWFKRSAD